MIRGGKSVWVGNNTITKINWSAWVSIWIDEMFSRMCPTNQKNIWINWIDLIQIIWKGSICIWLDLTVFCSALSPLFELPIFHLFYHIHLCLKLLTFAWLLPTVFFVFFSTALCFYARWWCVTYFQGKSAFSVTAFICTYTYYT